VHGDLPANARTSQRDGVRRVDNFWNKIEVGEDALEERQASADLYL